MTNDADWDELQRWVRRDNKVARVMHRRRMVLYWRHLFKSNDLVDDVIANDEVIQRCQALRTRILGKAYQLPMPVN